MEAEAEMRLMLISTAIVASLFLVVFVAFIWMALRMAKQRNQQLVDWNSTAQNLGFVHNPGFMKGSFEGFQVSVKIKVYGNGNSGQFLVFTVDMDDLPVGLAIQSEGLFSKTKKLVHDHSGFDQLTTQVQGGLWGRPVSLSSAPCLSYVL